MDWCEEGAAHEILRFWEPPATFVVLGYCSKVSEEVDVASCQRHGIPLLRRRSGGSTILQGPGCLNYTLILRIPNSGPLRGIATTNDFVMERHREALQPLLGPKLWVRGISDLTLGALKFSGNAQCRKRHFLLVHGTFLIHLDIALMEQLLPLPPRQSPYRRNRSHADFLTNLAISPDLIKGTLKRSWGAIDELRDLPLEKVHGLVSNRYSRREWTYRS